MDSVLASYAKKLGWVNGSEGMRAKLLCHRANNTGVAFPSQM